MKIVLFVEGYTERELPQFLKRWLDPQLAQPVGVLPVRFDGNMAYLREAGRKARLYLDQPDTLAVFGLLDLYGLKLDYPRLADRDDRLRFARQNILERIDPAYRERFRQHFAVHELEAWLLSDERLFPSITLPATAARPEDVNFDTPPAKLLDGLLSRGHGRGYKKTTMARVLLPKLDPNLVYQKCPNFKLLMDDMLAVARQSH